MSAQQQSPAATAKANVIVDRFKTRPCRNFTTHGACPYEERCMFAHGDEELRTREMNIQQGITTDEAVRAFQRNLRFQRQQRDSQQYEPQISSPERTATEPSTDAANPADESMVDSNWEHADSYNQTPSQPQQFAAGYGGNRTIQYDGPVPQQQQYYDNTCFCHDCNQARKAAGFYANYNYNSDSSAPCMCDECLAAQTDSSLTLSGQVAPSSPSSDQPSPKKQEVVPLRPQPRPKKSALRMAFSP